jgi:hypothetical protein
MRDEVTGLFSILFFHFHTCLLSQKMFLSQKKKLVLAQQRWTQYVFWFWNCIKKVKTHIDIFWMLKHLNVNLGIKRPVKYSPRRKLVENSLWELRRWGSISDNRTTSRCVKWPKSSMYKKQKVHGLIEAQKIARVQKYRRPLARHAGMISSFPTRK